MTADDLIRSDMQTGLIYRHWHKRFTSLCRRLQTRCMTSQFRSSRKNTPKSKIIVTKKNQQSYFDGYSKSTAETIHEKEIRFIVLHPASYWQ